MTRFEQQIKFILEIDKLKSIIRRSRLINNTRYENSAEHSWHFALMAITLAEYYPDSNKLDLGRVIKMALVHDIAEIDAGDTYCYDDTQVATQNIREEAAARRIFSLLPKDLSEEFYALWHEFEHQATNEARFARAIDRLNPFMLNFYSGGESWKSHGITKSQVLKRMGEIKETAPRLWQYIENLLEQAIKNNFILDL